MTDNIFDKLTHHGKNALKIAFNAALAFGHRTVTPQHVLYGLCMEKGSIAYQILIKSKIQSFEVKKILQESYPRRTNITQLQLGNDAKKLIEKSFVIASIHRHRHIGTEHLLSSLLSIGDDVTAAFLNQKGIGVNDIDRQIQSIMNSTSKFPEIAAKMEYSEEQDSLDGETAAETTTNPKSPLEMFAVNLTDREIQQTIDPVIGRDEEIARMIQILSRRTKNNPLLLGDPGVGKTAIVEGLAKKIVEGDVPELLRNKKIYNLDLSLVVAGTSFRGEFENRLKKILAEVKKNPDIILFIDEIHNLIGVGSATGSMDAANILKPALARGAIRCIGATTTEDYKKNIEADPALERRFQTIFVHQPSPEKAVEILDGIKSNYEFYHQVRISPAAIRAAVSLSDRYISDKFLPDKAIDLIDESAAAARVNATDDPALKKINHLQRQLELLTEKKQIAVAKEKFTQALKYRQQEQDLQRQLRQLQQDTNPSLSNKTEITENDVAVVVSKITGIPLDNLIAEERKRLINLERELEKRIVGQTNALRDVAELVRRSRAGISDVNRPIGSFMFLGPSGVGKTEAARQLAEIVFGSKEALIKIDMSEFAESFNISKLIGAPAGYVGYKESAKLTDSVKRRPYSVVLFDEIEKAHRQIFNLLLQVLEDGYLTDATGKKINFRNTLIIMTSNVGADQFNRFNALGFHSAETPLGSFEITKDNVLGKLKDVFPPEFLSRIDKTVVFEPLTDESLESIATLHLENLKQRLAHRGITLSYGTDAARHIARTNFSPDIGARSIRKNIQDLIENKIAYRLLAQEKKRRLSLKIKNNKIVL